jgi:SNF2 family DNA or RNA helicase
MLARDHNQPILTRLVLRNRDDWLEQSLRTPQITYETILCANSRTANALRGFISAEALEALHAGDTAAALAALGLNPVAKMSLVDQVTTGLYKDLIQAERLLEFKRESRYSSPAVKEQAIAKATEKVARIREQIEALRHRLAGLDDTANCPICYDTPTCPALTPCCHQTFCLSCLCQCVTVKSSCPLCREKITNVRDVVVIGEPVVVASGAGQAPAAALPAKGAALLKIITEAPASARFLIFSAHERSFTGLADVLQARGISSAMMCGSSTHIEALRRRFQSGDLRVLCLNAKNVGAGLNLDAATHVILYHRMNTELERQVIGRAVRFERSASLRVVYLTHDGETTQTGHQQSAVDV